VLNLIIGVSINNCDLGDLEELSEGEFFVKDFIATFALTGHIVVNAKFFSASSYL